MLCWCGIICQPVSLHHKPVYCIKRAEWIQLVLLQRLPPKVLEFCPKVWTWKNCSVARHVSFMRICDCRIFRSLRHFLHISARYAYCIFFLHKLTFSTAVLILFVFLLPIYIRFHYLCHLIANRMTPSMCPGPCGTRWGSWFQAILYHISAAYLVSVRLHIFLNAA